MSSTSDTNSTNWAYRVAILDVCTSFMTINENTRTIRLVHYTAQGYLSYLFFHLRACDGTLSRQHWLLSVGPGTLFHAHTRTHQKITLLYIIPSTGYHVVAQVLLNILAANSNKGTLLNLAANKGQNVVVWLLNLMSHMNNNTLHKGVIRGRRAVNRKWDHGNGATHKATK